MASRQNPKSKAFGRYVASKAGARGYVLSGDGKAKLAEAAGMSEADITKILNGEYEIQPDPLKPLATALDVPQKELLRMAGVLEGRATLPQDRPLTVQLAAQRLGIKSPKNVEFFQILVTALLDAEKRH
ncbi:helix-turn-helix domain-containing protein [Streptomyces sp. NBRC 110035]|uniref:helix-turn-helix domain-containing protein n=1 Tax=Streptomyces sp. NBRC 110035 TaxID=1547867 RepID=UPI00131EA3B9|nr:helix-turn-helix domain-containing protein [Streptomyces sp. NBRC 110035]